MQTCQFKISKILRITLKNPEISWDFKVKNPDIFPEISGSKRRVFFPYELINYLLTKPLNSRGGPKWIFLRNSECTPLIPRRFWYKIHHFLNFSKKLKIGRPPAIFVNGPNFDQFAPENTTKNLVFVIFRVKMAHFSMTLWDQPPTMCSWSIRINW